MYHFLTYECGCYLPPYDNVTIFHMRDLAAGLKKIVKGQSIHHISVPQYEGLNIESFLSFGKDFQLVKNALPDSEKEVGKMPRQYIANIIHTIVGQPFAEWVVQRVNARHTKMTESRDMNIQLDPEVAAAYQRSMAVSGKF